MKYYIISGETSGDNHASRVIQKIAELDKNAQYRGMGGDKSQAAGQTLFIHQKEMAIMGFVEILSSLFKIFRNLKKIKRDILEWKPDALILVDYPGFNFKIARFGKSINIPVHYYISPKAWAWKEKRVNLIKRDVDYLYSILPFEEAFFKPHGVKSIYVGNPSKETVDEYIASSPTPDKKNCIVLLPGSRKQEIQSSLPIMLEAIKDYDSTILVAQAPGFDENFYHQFNPKLKLISNDMYTLLNKSKLALVTSGTATLETALMDVPQIVCYTTNQISYWIGKSVIKVKFISLVNLILDKMSITELIQDEFNPERLRTEINKLTGDSEKIKEIRSDYKELRKILGNTRPSKKVAKSVVDSLKID
mgnify:CR=1 FL=1